MQVRYYSNLCSTAVLFSGVVMISALWEGQIETYNLQTQLNQISGHLTKTVGLKASDLTSKQLNDLYSLLVNPRRFLELPVSSENGNVSETCAGQLTKLAKDSLTSSEVLDSWGKPEAGLFQGNTKWLGNFDECLNITSSGFDTRYCSLSIKLSGQYMIEVGACAPRSCKSGDLKILIDSVLQSNTTGVLCKPLPSERPWYGGTTAALFFVMLVIGICCLATIYEILLLLMASIKRGDQSEPDEKTPLLGTIQSESAKHQRPSQERNLVSRVVLSFSFYTNALKLLDTTQPPGTITCLNGIRFFSMSWVILGHCLLFYSTHEMKNSLWEVELMKRWTFQPILNATVSVDTFFVLSGFLVAYLLLKDFNKRKIQIKGFFKALPMIYLQRYFRLTPAYGFMILIWSCLLYYTWDGPNWIYNKEYPTTMDKNCPERWYLNLLYVSTIFYDDKQCAGWGWYLSNDFQFFLIAPFIVFTYYLNEILGLLFAALTTAGSIVAAIAVSDEQRYPLLGKLPGPHYDFSLNLAPIHLPEYSVPWTRYQTYGLGLITGMLYYKLKTNKTRIPTLLNMLLWSVSGGMCLAYLYGPYQSDTGGHLVTLGEVDAQNSLGRTAWGLGVSYFIISCALGQGGWVNDFLSWKGFILLSRLTYCSYLIHIPILYWLIYASRSGNFYTDVNLVKDFLVVLVLTMGLAFPFSLIFEVPFINLDKLFLAPLSIKSHRKIEETNPAHRREADRQPSFSEYRETEEEDGTQK